MFRTFLRKIGSAKARGSVRVQRGLLGPEYLDERVALAVDVTTLGNPIAVAADGDLPTVAIAPSGNYFVAWDGDLDVNGQLRSIGGDTLGEPFEVSQNTEKDRQLSSAVGMADDGSFIISWRVASTPSRVLAQLHDASGNIVGSLIQIPDGVAHDVAKSNQTAVVAWSDTSNQVRAQIFDSNGIPVLLEPLNLGSGFSPTVSMSSDQSFVVAWQSYDPLKPGILGQRFNSAGQPIGQQFQFDNTFEPGTIETDPDVASDGHGNFVLTWENFVPELGLILPAAVQRFDSNGNPFGNLISIDSAASQPQVDMDSSGNFVITWQAVSGALKAQAFTAEQAPDTSAIIDVAANEVSAGVALNDTGNFVLVSTDFNSVWVREYQTSLTPGDPFTDPVGTEDDDVIEVSISETEYSITTNGGTPMVVRIVDAPQLEVDGGAGNDKLVIVGSTLDDQAFADGESGEVTLRSSIYEMIANGFERVTIDGGGGKDGAEMYGSSDITKRDRLFGYPTDTAPTVMHAGVTNLNLFDADYVFEMQNFLRIDSFGRGGWDYATVFGTNENDHFYRFSDYEVLVANGMIQKTKDFARVDVYGRHGNDSAHLTDTAGDDKFFSFPEFSVMLLGDENKDRIKIQDFEHLHVNSRHGGSDTAYLSRVQSADALFAVPDVVWMTRSSRFETILGFHSFIASTDENETPFLSIFDDVENLITTGTWIDLV